MPSSKAVIAMPGAARGSPDSEMTLETGRILGAGTECATVGDW